MKIFLLLSAVALVRQATCSGVPELGADPNTVADCVEWYNNGSDNESCEYVRKYFGISPEVFHKWNPSVGLDCKPWEYQSYCIVTQEKLDDTAATATTSSSSKTATSTTSSATLAPSPTSWTAMGCYADDSSFPILEKNLSLAGGDTALSISRCQNTCYLQSYGFAGVQEGNQCWCSSYVGGEWARNQTDCNIRCTGDKKTFCGGKGVLNVFKAEENIEPPYTVTTSSATVSSVDPTAESVLSTTHSSGAMRNIAMF